MYAYDDDLAIMHAVGYWQVVEGMLSKDMTTPDEYLQTWKLKFSTTKTVSEVFNFNNKEAKRELKVKHSNETLPFCSEPKFLALRQVAHVSPTRRVNSQEADITRRSLEVACWSAGATTLRTGLANSPGPFNSKSATLLSGAEVLTPA